MLIIILYWCFVVVARYNQSFFLVARSFLPFLILIVRSTSFPGLSAHVLWSHSLNLAACHHYCSNSNQIIMASCRSWLIGWDQIGHISVRASSVRPRALPAPSRRDHTAAQSSTAGHQQNRMSTNHIRTKSLSRSRTVLGRGSPSNHCSDNLIIFRQSGSKRGREMTALIRISLAQRSFWQIFNWVKSEYGGSLYALRVKIKSHLRLARLENGDSHDAAEARKWKPKGIRRFCNLCEAGEFFFLRYTLRE